MGISKRRSGRDETTGASDQAVKWLEGMAGFVAHVKSEYGSISEMAEQPNWDASRNQYVLSLLKGLKKEIAQLTTEFKEHVESQTG